MCPCCVCLLLFFNLPVFFFVGVKRQTGYLVVIVRVRVRVTSHVLVFSPSSYIFFLIVVIGFRCLAKTAGIRKIYLIFLRGKVFFFYTYFIREQIYLSLVKNTCKKKKKSTVKNLLRENKTFFSQSLVYFDKCGTRTSFHS